MNTTEIENVLRQAPAPRPPAGLKERLQAELRLPPPEAPDRAPTTPVRPRSWLRRWWPALAPAAVSLAGAMVCALQQMEISDLRQTIQTLTPPAAAGTTLPSPEATAPLAAAGAATAQDQEIARLKDLTTKLAAEVAQAEQVRAENEKLRGQIAAATAPGLTAEEQEAILEARWRADTTGCANNLKQLGLAVKTWALDNDDRFPTHVLEMTNEMATPKILVCPADTGRQPAANWSTFTAANCSYEYLAAAASAEEPNRVVFRCPIHNNVLLADGSVQLMKHRPDMVIERNGKLYVGEPGPQPGPTAPPPNQPINPPPQP